MNPILGRSWIRVVYNGIVKEIDGKNDIKLDDFMEYLEAKTNSNWADECNLTIKESKNQFFTLQVLLMAAFIFNIFLVLGSVILVVQKWRIKENADLSSEDASNNVE